MFVGTMRSECGAGASHEPNHQKEHTLANQGTASLGNVSRGGSAAFPTNMPAPKYLNPVSAATIERLTGVKLPHDTNPNFEGYHAR